LLFTREPGSRGFTLPEIIVATLVVALLGAIAVPAYMGTRNSANAAVASQDAAAIATGVGQLLMNTPSWSAGSMNFGSADDAEIAPLTIIVDGATLTGQVRLSAGSTAIGFLGVNTWCIQVDNRDARVTVERSGKLTEGGTCNDDGSSGGGDDGGGGGGDVISAFTIEYENQNFTVGSDFQELVPTTFNESGPVSYEITSGDLPEGVTFDDATGAFIGPSSTEWNFQAVQVAAGGVSAVTGTTCAVTNTGGVKCWGSNDYGQLGDGSTAESDVPLDVLGLDSEVENITVGGYHACASLSSGGVKCWGYNNAGQLGDGSTDQSSYPVDVPELNGVQVVSLSAGANHTCAVTIGGEIYCWGYNFYGQLGDGTSGTDRLSPVLLDTSNVASGFVAVSVSAGQYFTCAIVLTGDASLVAGARCWGRNNNGQLGDGSTTQRNRSVAVGGGLSSGVLSLSAGTEHACVVITGGVGRCWGRNTSGQLGNGAVTTRQTTPVAVSGLAGATQISAALSSTCTRLEDGSAKCWGSNSLGVLGDDTGTLSSTPVDVQGISTGAVGISGGSGAAHVCAVFASGLLQCWGANNRGQIGDGNLSTEYFSPVTLASTGAQPGFPSYFTVFGTDDLETTPTSFTLDILTIPSLPNGVTATLDSGNVTLAWNAAGYSGFSPVAGYEIQYRERPTEEWVDYPEVVPVTASATMIEEIAPSTYYDFRIRAINDQGGGAWYTVSLLSP